MIVWLIAQARIHEAIDRLRTLALEHGSQGWRDLERLDICYRDHGTGAHYPPGRVVDCDVEDLSCWTSPGEQCVAILAADRVLAATDAELCGPPPPHSDT